MDCITSAEPAQCAIREGHSCVISAPGEVDAAGSSLHVCLHDGDDPQYSPAACHLCLDARLLGVNGSAELLKQFAVQQLMIRRASSRRV